MDKKNLNLNRYKRYFKLTEDFDWLTKFASEDNSIKHNHYQYPTIGEFVNYLIEANVKPFEGDIVQGRVGAYVAKILANHYRKHLDLKKDAFTKWNLSENPYDALTSDLTKFSKSEIKELTEKTKSIIRASGDEYLVNFSRGLKPEDLQDTIDFVLARAYVFAFWMFLFQNPIVSVLIENDGKPFHGKAALSAKQLRKNAEEEEDFFEELEDDSSVYEETKQDLLELERADWLEEPGTRPPAKEKKQQRINDFTGKKIRLSDLIKAFKVTRAQQGFALQKNPRSSIAQSNYLATMANIDYLERAAKAIKDYIAANPNNAFLKWHGQPIGANGGDPWVTTTGKSWNTLDMMKPPSFIQGFKKSQTVGKGGKDDVKDEYSRHSIRIPFKSWDGQEKEYLGELLPSDIDIYNNYVVKKFGNLKDFRKEISNSLMSDIKTLNDFRDAFSANAERGEILMSEHMQELFAEQMSLSFFTLSEEERASVYNRIYKVINDTIKLVSNSTLEEYKNGIKGLTASLLSDEIIAPYFRSNSSTLFSAVSRLLDEMNVIVNPDIIPFAYEDLAHTTVKEAKNINLASAAKALGIENTDFAEEIKDRIKEMVSRRDAEIKEKTGFEPGFDTLRDASNYSDISEILIREFEAKYPPPEKNVSLVKDIVVNIGMSLYPDAFTKIVGAKRWRQFMLQSGQKGSGSYTVKQSQNLANVLGSPLFLGDYDFEQKTFVEQSRQYSLLEFKKRTSNDLKEAYNFVKSAIEDGRIPFPNPSNPDPKLVEEALQKVSDKDENPKMTAIRLASIEEIRRWMKKYKGSPEDPRGPIRQILGEAEVQPANYLSMALYVYVGEQLAGLLGEDIVRDIYTRFASPKIRGVVGVTELTASPEDRAKIMARYYSYVGGRRSAGEDEINDFGGEASPAFYKEKAEMDWAAEQDFMDFDHIEERLFDPSDPSKTSFSKDLDAATAKIEADNYFNMMLDNRFAIVNTRKTRYESVEEARKKPVVALSTHSIGGFVQQMMGLSKSPYLDDYLNHPEKFKVWFKASCSMSFGNHIGRIVDYQLRSLYNSPNAKYSSVEELMDKVGAFADPMWAFNPFTQAFGKREVSKRTSGYIADVPDTAYDHMRRACYNAPSLASGSAEAWLIAYFDEAANRIKSRFDGVSPQQIEATLIHRFDISQGTNRNENWTNNPFKGYTPQQMGKLLSDIGVSPASLEIMFGELAATATRIKEQKLNSVREYLDPNNDEDQMKAEKKVLAAYEYASKFSLNGKRNDVHAILDEAFDNNKDVLDEEQGGKLVEAIDQIKKSLVEMTSSDTSAYVRIYKTWDGFNSTVNQLIESLPKDFDDVKDVLRSHLTFAKAQADLIPELENEIQGKYKPGFEERVQEVVEKEVSSTPSTEEEIVNNFEEAKEQKKKTYVREKAKPAEENSVNTLKVLADTLTRRFSELREMFFNNDEFYSYVVGRPEYNEDTLRDTAENVQEYIEFIRSIRPDQIGKQDISLKDIQDQLKEISSMGPYSFVQIFSSDNGLRDRKQKIVDAFLLKNVVVANKNHNPLILSLGRPLENRWDDTDYYHFM